MSGSVESPVTAEERLEWQATAAAAARAAGQLARRLRQGPLQAYDKGFRDVVTEADFAAQRLIAEQIRARYPAHGFLAEEADDALSAAAPIVWIIDPLDGTSNYSRGIPIYNVSIAVAVHGRVEAGVVYDPVGDELFAAARGQGATCNGVPLRVSPLHDLSAAIVALDWSRSAALRTAVNATLSVLAHRVHTVRAVGSAALALAWVAAGRLDGYLNFSLGPWDIAAGSLLVAEAGGRTSGVDDADLALDRPQSWALTSNGALHRPLLDCLPPIPG